MQFRHPKPSRTKQSYACRCVLVRRRSGRAEQRQEPTPTQSGGVPPHTLSATRRLGVAAAPSTPTTSTPSNGEVGVDQVARDAAAAAQLTADTAAADATAAEVLASGKVDEAGATAAARAVTSDWAEEGNVELPPASKSRLATTSERGAVEGSGTNSQIDTEAGSSIRGWSVSHIYRAITRRVSSWARGIGLVPPSALFGQNHPVNRTVVVNSEGNFQLIVGTPGGGEADTGDLRFELVGQFAHALGTGQGGYELFDSEIALPADGEAHLVVHLDETNGNQGTETILPGRPCHGSGRCADLGEWNDRWDGTHECASAKVPGWPESRVCARQAQQRQLSRRVPEQRFYGSPAGLQDCRPSWRRRWNRRPGEHRTVCHSRQYRRIPPERFPFAHPDLAQ